MQRLHFDVTAMIDEGDRLVLCNQHSQGYYWNVDLFGCFSFCWTEAGCMFLLFQVYVELVKVTWILLGCVGHYPAWIGSLLTGVLLICDKGEAVTKGC